MCCAVLYFGVLPSRDLGGRGSSWGCLLPWGLFNFVTLKKAFGNLCYLHFAFIGIGSLNISTLLLLLRV